MSETINKLYEVEPYLKYPSDDNPTTEQEYQDFVKNVHGIVRNMVDSSKLWQPSTEYAVDEIISSPNMEPNTLAKVTTAGTSNTIEPTWTEAGTTVEDNGCAYLIVRKCQESATLDEASSGTDESKIITAKILQEVIDERLADFAKIIFPVGTILHLTSSADPNKYIGGTWEYFGIGRTLIAAGTYTENGTNYVYTNGDTGGEATHQLTTGEMPSHSHGASSSSIGAHNHSFSQRDQANPDNGVMGGGAGHWSTAWTSTSGAHTHTIYIDNAGGNSAHENRQPFTVVFRWARIA